MNLVPLTPVLIMKNVLKQNNNLWASIMAGNSFYVMATTFIGEESISLEIIISFSLQGQVKKTKLQRRLFSHAYARGFFA